MSTEFISIVLLLVLCSILFSIIDVAVSGLLALIFGICFKKAFCWGLLSLLIPPILIAYGILIGRNCYQVKEIELSYPNLPSSFDGYRIVQLSDIHSRSFQHRLQSLQKAVNLANAQHPDLIVFTGDLMTISPEEVDITGPVLRQLQASDGVISIIGNHDYGIYMSHSGRQQMAGIPMEVLVEKEKSLNWQVLLNDHCFIHRNGDSIAIVGVENTSPSKYFPSTGKLKQAATGTEGHFRILLSHDPMHWEQEVVGQDFPLMLSGHTHSAQFSFFGCSPSRWVFKQYKGLYSKGMQKLYVNIGLGETIIPLRIGARPEITVITLKTE